MERRTIHTDKAPAAIGPYAQANRVGNFLYTSGQIALDPDTGEVVAGGIKEQTERVLENLKNVVEAGGGAMDGVIKATVFLKNMADFAEMNEVYERYFTGEALPSRSAVAVVTLPKDVLVEIEVVALIE
ncbi:MAG: RidA family protein [Clostridiales Family XIII bacterium]|jgi:2-iminobutanoate/2-iminopropanoate deaminase|nr:RidA family protein [Clostridiales Family XIII bacterium]